MFLRLPSRFKPFYYVSFAFLLGLVELTQGSDPYCVACMLVFIIIAADAFNRCEGFRYASGSYIFFGATLTLLIGAVWKAILWQPLDRNLLDPQRTFSVYAVGMVGFWIAAVLNSRLRAKKAFMQADIPIQHQMRAALGCLVIGISIMFMGAIMQAAGSAGISSALQQINALPALGVMVAVYYQLRNTAGEQSFSKVALICALSSFLVGVAAFSKQGMFTPFAAWALSALAVGYRTTAKHIAILSICAVAAMYVLVPYSQYGRSHREEFGGPVDAIVMMITHPEDIVQKAKENEELQAAQQKDIGYRFYDQPQGFFDRLTMVAPDDALIARTGRGYTKGWDIVAACFMNLMPRFVFPEKPDLHIGNSYAHEVGILADDDVTTGVSFSPFSEAYHIGGWVSLLILTSTLLFMLFWIADSFVGSLDASPWPLLFVLNFSHTAPEGGITGSIYTGVYGLLTVTFAIFVATKIAPLLGSVLMGPEKAILPLPQRTQVHTQRGQGL